MIRTWKNTEFIQDTDIPQKLHTRVRLFTNKCQDHFQKVGQSFETNPAKMLGYSLGLETLFYLPNRFRNVVLLNSVALDTTSSENALLGAMKYMFNLEQGVPGGNAFSIRNFMQCYAHFFRSTMVYEAGSFCVRNLAYQQLKQGSMLDWPVSFAIGTLTQQVLLLPFYKRHLQNHV